MEIKYVCPPTAAQLDQAADLIDSGGQLAEKLDRKRLRRACAVVVALNKENVVIGVGAIKERQDDVAETGYLIVDLAFRNHGIGHELTKRRLEAAKNAGLALVYTNVHRTNIESIGNLKKAEFQFYGDFLSAHGTSNVISWFFYLFDQQIDARERLSILTRGLEPA